MRKTPVCRRTSTDPAAHAGRSLRCIGQVQGDAETSAFPVGELDAPAVRLGDFARERQPRPVPLRLVE